MSLIVLLTRKKINIPTNEPVLSWPLATVECVAEGALWVFKKSLISDKQHGTL
jgi:hypothetical protein